MQEKGHIASHQMAPRFVRAGEEHTSCTTAGCPRQHPSPGLSGGPPGALDPTAVKHIIMDWISYIAKLDQLQAARVGVKTSSCLTKHRVEQTSRALDTKNDSQIYQYRADEAETQRQSSFMVRYAQPIMIVTTSCAVDCIMSKGLLERLSRKNLPS